MSDIKAVNLIDTYVHLLQLKDFHILLQVIIDHRLQVKNLTTLFIKME